MPVEPKAKLVQIGLKGLITDPMINTPDPTFQLLDKPVDGDGIFSGLAFGLGNIPFFGQWGVGPPSISIYRGLFANMAVKDLDQLLS